MGHKPLYRQIADRIREQIARGELKPGDALPTESALQTEFGVSRVTVRQALRQLVEQQILESIQGSGTYVKEERVNYDIFQLTSFDEKLSDRHVETHSEVLIFEVIPADNFLQQQLHHHLQGPATATAAAETPNFSSKALTKSFNSITVKEPTASKMSSLVIAMLFILQILY